MTRPKPCLAKLSVVLVTGAAFTLMNGVATAQKPAKMNVPENVVFVPNIEYANPGGQHLQLDLARPKAGDGPFPAAVCIHGGGFRAGTRQGYDGLCLRLAQHGYVAVTVSYRLAPKYQFPAAVHDVKAAVRWLRANAKEYRIDPDRIGVTGGSAGGHLAQVLGVTADVRQFEGDGGNPEQSSRVACVVNYFGPSDFTKSYGKSVDAAEVLPLWLGGNLEQMRQKHVVASPLYWVTPDAAPTLCIHGTEDKYVAYEQAVWLIDRLKAAGVEADLLALGGAGHGFKGHDAEIAESAMLAFFAKHLKRPTAALQPTRRDVHYGPHPRNLLDFWQARSDRPTPVLVSIHGGGFLEGKKSVNAQLLSECLQSGISVAAITYRFSTEAIAPAPFRDCARAVQFIRSKAEEWNIDPRRVAATGSSAGAGLSLWLGFHDDMADPRAKDAVDRQSSRLTCMVVFDGQSSYDPRFVRSLFPGKGIYKNPALAKLLGVDLRQLDDLPPDKCRLAEEISPFHHVTKDDPPVLLVYSNSLDAEITNPGVGIHHARFGKVLKDKMDAVGIPCEVDAGNQRLGGGTPTKPIDFLKRHLGVGK
jgi:acetyl esterase/lipase